MGYRRPTHIEDSLVGPRTPSLPRRPHRKLTATERERGNKNGEITSKSQRKPLNRHRLGFPNLGRRQPVPTRGRSPEHFENRQNYGESVGYSRRRSGSI